MVRLMILPITMGEEPNIEGMLCVVYTVLNGRVLWDESTDGILRGIAPIVLDSCRAFGIRIRVSQQRNRRPTRAYQSHAIMKVLIMGQMSSEHIFNIATEDHHVRFVPMTQQPYKRDRCPRDAITPSKRR